MALSYLLVAVLAIAGYEALRAMYTRRETAEVYTDSETAGDQFARAAIVIAGFIVAMPLGAFLGMSTVSAATNDLVTGALVLAGSVMVVATVGLGLYIVAEGEIPGFLGRDPRAR